MEDQCTSFSQASTMDTVTVIPDLSLIPQHIIITCKVSQHQNNEMQEARNIQQPYGDTMCGLFVVISYCSSA